MLYHYAGAPLEELIDVWSYFFWPPLVNQRGESPGICKHHGYFREVAHLPMSVSNVADIGVLQSAVDAQ